jgi:dsRNA-specific ribonuclease
MLKLTPSLPSYENLASEGLKILEIFISNILKNIYPDIPEDKFYEVKNSLINDKFLKELSEIIMLDKYLKIKSKKTGPLSQVYKNLLINKTSLLIKLKVIY